MAPHSPEKPGHPGLIDEKKQGFFNSISKNFFFVKFPVGKMFPLYIIPYFYKKIKLGIFCRDFFIFLHSSGQRVAIALSLANRHTREAN
jgi:hypothetical protein